MLQSLLSTRWFACLILLTGLLSGCGAPLSPDAFGKTPEALFMRNMVEQLSRRDYVAIEAQGDSQLDTANIRHGLERMAALLPKEAPLASEPVAWKVTTVANGTRVATVAAEYSYPGKRWVLVSAQLSGEPGQFRILGFRIEPLPVPLAELHAFNFHGKGAVHYLFLLLTAGAVMITLAALVLCVRTRELKRKWLWIVFILFGVGAATLNWTTGEIGLNPLYFNLLSAGVMRTGWSGPWLVTFCLPVGALVFLWKQRQRLVEADVVVE
ncbi:hypothetical protein [Chitinimonas naiadis]